MQCDQVIPFPFEQEVPGIFKHKIVRKNLSEFFKIPNIIHTIKMYECCTSPTILLLPTSLVLMQTSL